MKDNGQIVVIGGGVIGVCSAYFLAKQGAKVLTIDQGEIGAGCSYGNAGLIVPSHSVPLPAPGVLGKAIRWMANAESPFYIKPRLDLGLLAWLCRFGLACRGKKMRAAIPLIRDLSRASLALHREFAAFPGFETDFGEKGMLMLFKDQKHLKEGIEESDLLRDYGIPSTVLDKPELRSFVPNVRPDVLGGIHYPEDAHLSPARFVQAVANLAEKKGAGFRTRTEVLGFETSRHKILSVKTTRGDLPCSHVVLAAGSWSPRLAQDFRLCLPIQPAKGYSITVKQPQPPLPLPMILSEPRVAVTPMGPLLRFGGTLELAGFDFALNRRRAEAVERAPRHYLHGLENLELVEIWRGLRPCTPDGLPIIGRADQFENLVIATGHCMLGLSLGPITGKLVSQLLCGETPDVDLTRLSPKRFR